MNKKIGGQNKMSAKQIKPGGMPPEEENKGVLVLYREVSQKVVDETNFFFNTEPFLVGIGCGGHITVEYIDSFIKDVVKLAIEKGYRVYSPKRFDGKRKAHPLHSEALKELSDYLS